MLGAYVLYPKQKILGHENFRFAHEYGEKSQAVEKIKY
jgi:hypothetical protein